MSLQLKMVSSKMAGVCPRGGDSKRKSDNPHSSGQIVKKRKKNHACKEKQTNRKKNKCLIIKKNRKINENTTKSGMVFGCTERKKAEEQCHKWGRKKKIFVEPTITRWRGERETEKKCWNRRKMRGRERYWSASSLKWTMLCLCATHLHSVNTLFVKRHWVYFSGCVCVCIFRAYDSMFVIIVVFCLASNWPYTNTENIFFRMTQTLEN